MVSVIHHRFSVQVYDQMIEAGIFTENDPVELINREIIKKIPVGRLHVAMVNRLNQRLVMQFAGQAIVSVQNPIILVDSQPEPDISLLDPRDDFYATTKATANDVRLLALDCEGFFQLRCNQSGDVAAFKSSVDADDGDVGCAGRKHS